MASSQTKDCTQCLAWTYYPKNKSLGVLSAEPASSFSFMTDVMMLCNDILKDLLGCFFFFFNNSTAHQSLDMGSHSLGYTFTSALPASFCVSPLPCVVSTSATATSSTGVVGAEGSGGAEQGSHWESFCGVTLMVQTQLFQFSVLPV